MLDHLSELKGEELIGAGKTYSFFLRALEGEINIAYNVLRMKEFAEATANVREALEKAQLNQYDEAMRLLSEAISHIASSGQWAMQTLKNKGLL